MMRLFRGEAWTPEQLDPFLWLDPSDMSTLFQDTDGEVPVTTLGQSVKRINDKSGNSRHATEATNAPLWISNSGNGRALSFNGSNQKLTTPNFTLSQPYTRIYAAQLILNNNNSDALFSGSNGKGWTRIANGYYNLYMGEGASGPFVGDFTTKPKVVVEIWDGTTSRMSVNGGPFVPGSAGADSLPNLIMGSWSGTSGFCGYHLYGVVVLDRIATASEIKMAVQSFRQRLALDTVKTLWVAEGDSVTQATATRSYPSFATYQIDEGLRWENVASPSALLNPHYIGRAEAVRALKTPSVERAFLTILPGNDMTNSYFVQGSREAWLTALANYIAPFRAEGWEVGMCTHLPRSVGATIEDYNVERHIVNDVIRTTFASNYDFLIDFDLNEDMGDDEHCLDTSKYNDGVHITTLGGQLLAPTIAAAINAQLAA